MKKIGNLKGGRGGEGVETGKGRASGTIFFSGSAKWGSS